jgi:hypothetical protein
MTAGAGCFEKLAADGCWLQQRLGNLYCGSLYCGLAALVERKGAELEGKRVLLFSFGSGTVAKMFALVGRRPSACAGLPGGSSGPCGVGARGEVSSHGSTAQPASLADLQARSDLQARLDQRQAVDVQRYGHLADVAVRNMLQPEGEREDVAAAPAGPEECSTAGGAPGSAGGGNGCDATRGWDGMAEAELWPGTWRLGRMDHLLRRQYVRQAVDVARGE